MICLLLPGETSNTIEKENSNHITWYQLQECFWIKFSASRFQSISIFAKKHSPSNRSEENNHFSSYNTQSILMKYISHFFVVFRRKLLIKISRIKKKKKKKNSTAA
jgi:hypothetical protein